MRDAVLPFGKDANQFIQMMDDLGLANARGRYLFQANDDFRRVMCEDPKLGTKNYWIETLGRVHLTAVVSILRSRHWIDAIAVAIENNNLLLFSAAFRGLIESAADTSSALGAVPETLAREHAAISGTLAGTFKGNILISKELEDELIHFSHARHLTKSERAVLPRSHEVKKVRDYLDVLERGQVREIMGCYKSLCDLTHPGASSVWMWLISENGSDVDLCADQDARLIASYLAEYRETFLDLLMFAFNPAVVVLNILNYYPVQGFHTPKLLAWDLAGIPLWRKCKSELAGASPFARPVLESVISKSAK